MTGYDDWKAREPERECEAPCSACGEQDDPCACLRDCPQCGGSGGGDGPMRCRACFGYGERLDFSSARMHPLESDGDAGWP
jgi:hypothetical protein